MFCHLSHERRIPKQFEFRLNLMTHPGKKKKNPDSLAHLLMWKTELNRFILNGNRASLGLHSKWTNFVQKSIQTFYLVTFSNTRYQQTTNKQIKALRRPISSNCENELTKQEKKSILWRGLLTPIAGSIFDLKFSGWKLEWFSRTGAPLPVCYVHYSDMERIHVNPPWRRKKKQIWKLFGHGNCAEHPNILGPRSVKVSAIHVTSKTRLRSVSTSG